MNLRPAFHYPGLILVVGEPEDLVVQPLASFKRAFLGIVLATLVVVSLASLRQIRSSLVPLEKLREGTRDVAAGVFGRTVTVESRDEMAETVRVRPDGSETLQLGFQVASKVLVEPA